MWDSLGSIRQRNLQHKRLFPHISGVPRGGRGWELLHGGLCTLQVFQKGPERLCWPGHISCRAQHCIQALKPREAPEHGLSSSLGSKQQRWDQILFLPSSDSIFLPVHPPTPAPDPSAPTWSLAAQLLCHPPDAPSPPTQGWRPKTRFWFHSIFVTNPIPSTLTSLTVCGLRKFSGTTVP